MRPSPTDRLTRPQGSVEVLLLLPLLLVLAWGSSLLGWMVIRESRAQQAVWAYTTARGHRSSDEGTARRMAEQTARLPRSSLEVRSSPECLRWLDLLSSAAPVPTSYSLALRTHCPSHHRLVFEEPLPGAIGNLLRPDRHPFPAWKRSIEAVTPGDDFRGSRTVRQSLWQEAMARAGFGSLPLQLLAVPELSSVIGVDLGGPAEEILRRWKGALP